LLLVFSVWLGGTCGASLIAKGVVLTAAHCADGGSLLGSFASVGAFDADGVLVVAVKSRITDQFIHPSYDASTISNDYMLLRLEVPVDLPPTNDGTSGVLTLNYDDTVPANGQSLTVMGLGLEAEGNWDGADALRYVVVKKIAYKVCTKSYDGEVQEDSMFCAGTNPKKSFLAKLDVSTAVTD
jgi:secreted trypsin-like serine protease